MYSPHIVPNLYYWFYCFSKQKGHEGYIQGDYFEYNESEWGLGLYNFKVIKNYRNI